MQESPQVPCTSWAMLWAVVSSSLALNLKALAFSWSHGKPCKNCLCKPKFVSARVSCWFFTASAAGVAAKGQLLLFNNPFCSSVWSSIRERRNCFVIPIVKPKSVRLSVGTARHGETMTVTNNVTVSLTDMKMFTQKVTETFQILCSSKQRLENWSKLQPGGFLA